MIPDIKSKLRVLLEEPIDSESKVVYLLCQLRKLYDNDKSAPLSVRLFVNWALHTTLSHSYIEPFIKDFDRFVELNRYGSADPYASAKVLPELIFLGQFKEDLYMILKRYDLHKEIDDKWWSVFLTHYCEVVEDCALIVPVKTPTKHIDRIIFTKVEILADGILLKWEAALKGGGMFKCEVIGAKEEAVKYHTATSFSY